MPNIKHIDITDGWIDVYEEWLYGTAKAYRLELRKHFVTKENLVPLDDLEPGIEPPTTLIDFGAIDADVMNELVILRQVKAWSFGEVDAETLYNTVTSKQYTEIAGILDELYKNPT